MLRCLAASCSKRQQEHEAMLREDLRQQSSQPDENYFIAHVSIECVSRLGHRISCQSYPVNWNLKASDSCVADSSQPN